MDDRTIMSLLKLFNTHRIVFWYDEKKELRDEFEGLTLDGIEKIEITNNEYMIKHKILREQKQHKFLIYHEGAKPLPSQNWLLDVLLSHAEFRVDQASIIVSELGLDISFLDVVRDHSVFFNAKKRIADVKPLLGKRETKGSFRKKLLASIVGTDLATIDSILLQLIDESSDGTTDRYRLVENCNLTRYLWEQVRDTYGYEF